MAGLHKTFFKTFINLYCPNPRQAEKANVKFYFLTLWYHKTSLRYIPQRSVEIKNYVNFILDYGLGMHVVAREKLETNIL